MKKILSFVAMLLCIAGLFAKPKEKEPEEFTVYFRQFTLAEWANIPGLNSYLKDNNNIDLEHITGLDPDTFPLFWFIGWKIIPDMFNDIEFTEKQITMSELERMCLEAITIDGQSPVTDESVKNKLKAELKKFKKGDLKFFAFRNFIVVVAFYTK